jgi:hypothetical protein
MYTRCDVAECGLKRTEIAFITAKEGVRRRVAGEEVHAHVKKRWLALNDIWTLGGGDMLKCIKVAGMILLPAGVGSKIEASFAALI